MNEDALERIERSLAAGTLDELSGLRGADLTTAMLELSRRRAAALAPSDVLARYRSDRFVGPGAIAPATVREVERAVFELLPGHVEEVALSPVVPIGTHGVGGVAQARVLTTDRGTEVAADPTNGLALEAALRRRGLGADDPRSAAVVRLAASQRVVRAQRFQEDAAFSHFQLFGLVSGGRGTGNLGFEGDELLLHLRFLVDAIERVTGSPARVALTDLTDGRMASVFEAVEQELEAEVVLDQDRQAGRDYYQGACYKGYALVDGEPHEVADGGFVDWTQRLLANRKERLLIGGLGIERLALARASKPPSGPA